MGKKKNKSKKKKSTGRNTEPSTGAVVYTGPAFMPRGLGGNDCITTQMTRVLDLTSSGVSVINSVISNDPSFANDWASVSGGWSEYRVLSMAVEFAPQNRYSKTTTLTRPICLVVDRGSPTALTSYGQAVDNGSFQMKSLDDPFGRGHKDGPFICRMSETNEADFKPVGSPVAEFWFKWYSDGLSATTIYGIVIYTWMVQFRNRA